MRQIDHGVFHLTGHAIDDLHSFGDVREKLSFIERFQRVVGPAPVRNPQRREMYPWLRPEASLVAFCILDNHYHVVLRQYERGGAERVMRSVLASYSRWFNARYGRRGTPVFEAPYGVRQVMSSLQGRRTMAYVHLNHEIELEQYEFSSHGYYAGRRESGLIDVRSGLSYFGDDYAEYDRFLFNDGMRSVQAKIARREQGRGRGRPKPWRGKPSHIR